MILFMNDGIIESPRTRLLLQDLIIAFFRKKIPALLPKGKNGAHIKNLKFLRLPTAQLIINGQWLIGKNQGYIPMQRKKDEQIVLNSSFWTFIPSPLNSILWITLTEQVISPIDEHRRQIQGEW